jgi:hypothetical protein
VRGWWWRWRCLRGRRKRTRRTPERLLSSWPLFILLQGLSRFHHPSVASRTAARNSKDSLWRKTKPSPALDCDRCNYKNSLSRARDLECPAATRVFARSHGMRYYAGSAIYIRYKRYSQYYRPRGCLLRRKETPAPGPFPTLLPLRKL